MITLEEDALLAANAPSPEWPADAKNAGGGTDSALLATVNSRWHCRTPMKRVVREELSIYQPIQVDGRDVARFEKGPAPEGVVTYRCLCGFTMDAPSVALDYAVAS